MDRGLLDAVYDLHDATTDLELHLVAMQAVRRLVGAELTTWVDVDLAEHRMVNHCEPEPLPAAFADFPLAAHDVPFVRATLRDPASSRALRLEDLPPEDHNREYESLARSAGCEHQIQVLLDRPTTHAWAVVTGTRPGSAFTDPERDRLTELGRHVRQAQVLMRHRTGNVTQAAMRAGLTRRQAEALQAVASGDTMAAAAATLGISPRTLDNHLQSAYRRLRVNSRLAAVRSVLNPPGADSDGP